MSGRFRLSIALLAAAGLSACEGRLTPPHGCPIAGIDLAHHQGDVDWARVAAAGTRFAWIKATEGGDYLDPAFRRNWMLAEAAGVHRGAYHFVYWCRPARDQANWFIANVPADPDALPPVLDIEWNPDSRSCPKKVPRERALAEIKIMRDAIKRAYGVRPILYVPGDIYLDVLEGAFEDEPLWVRGLKGRPALAYGARRWAVWQYAEEGRVPGIGVDVDLDCIAGRDATWRRTWEADLAKPTPVADGRASPAGTRAR